jgi:hypothetical protein
VVFEEMSGYRPDDAAVTALLAAGEGPMVELTDRSGKTFSGRLRWTGERVVAQRVEVRVEAGTVASCPRDAGGVRFADGRWRCDRCDFNLPAVVASRPVQPEDVVALCRDGETMRLYGFRQGSGKVLKAAMVLQDGQVGIDWDKGRPDWNDQPVPAGAPPPAFGATRTVCPGCLDRADPQPGWVVAGRAAWGCSKWRGGCKLQVPFTVHGEALDPDQAQRLLGKHRATKYAKRPVDGGGTLARARLVLDPEQAPCWSIHHYGTPVPEPGGPSRPDPEAP